MILTAEGEGKVQLKGLFIVVSRIGFDVQLQHFYNLIRGDEVDIAFLNLDNILKTAPLIGEDGLEVTLNPGDLVQVTHRPEIKAGLAFHMANCEPGQPESVVQYQYALSKIGMAPKKIIDKAVLSLDGQFRKLLADMAAGKKETLN